MDLLLKGKVAIVTGGGRGIGKGISRTLCEEGAKVVVNDFFEERALETAKELCDAGGTAIGIQADVIARKSVDTMIEQARKEFGPIDILVNNAGLPARFPKQIEEMEGAKSDAFFLGSERPYWDHTMNVVTYGVLNCVAAVLPEMVGRKYGKIINMVSDAGRIGEPRMAVYSMAKGGVISFSRALAKEVGRSGINVNCISPSMSDTGAMAASRNVEESEKLIQVLSRLYPLMKHHKRLGKPSDVAHAAAFLASDRAEWITGQVLSVNGGYAML